MDANLFRIGNNWLKEMSELALRIRDKYKVQQMKEFHSELDGRGVLLLKEAFSSFTWMDHWRIKVIGTSPQYYVVANTSDGTYNLLRGLPVHACSISFMKKPDEEPVLSLIKDTFRGDIFIADREGVRLNGKPIKTSKTENISDALLSVDPRDMNEELKEALVYRRLGSFSLEMGWLASGYLDSIIQPKEMDWAHFPAALHILKKAGGVVTNTDGAPINFKLDINSGSNVIASGNGNLHREVLKRVGK
jgi:fructose-1,6-bisphosphatase/inositol monophosphatase family enzyme